jgi:allophanate hydrolase subunit 2
MAENGQEMGSRSGAHRGNLGLRQVQGNDSLAGQEPKPKFQKAQQNQDQPATKE